MSIVQSMLLGGTICVALGGVQLFLKKAFVGGGPFVRRGFVSTNPWVVYPVAGFQVLLGLAFFGAAAYKALNLSHLLH